MKAYLFISGAIFALFAAMHFFIVYERWRAPAPGADSWFVMGPALIGICGGALATWAFRLTRDATRAAA